MLNTASMDFFFSEHFRAGYAEGIRRAKPWAGSARTVGYCGWALQPPPRVLYRVSTLVRCESRAVMRFCRAEA